MLAMRMIFAVVFSIIVVVFWNCARTQPQKESNEVSTTLVGTLNVTGNEPFVELRLYSDEGSSYTLLADSIVLKTLWQHQGEKVRCKGLLQTTAYRKAIKLHSYEFIKER